MGVIMRHEFLTCNNPTSSEGAAQLDLPRDGGKLQLQAIFQVGPYPVKGSPLMSALIAPDRPPEPGTPPFPIYRFTVAEYEELARLGVLTEDSNVELLEGWIVPKMTKYPPHDNCIDLLNHLLTRLLPPKWF